MMDRIRDALQKPGKRFSEPDLAQLPKAAVCMILKSDASKNQIAVLLVQRKISESDPWSGHMAFPGGKYEEEDGNLLNTATREVMEECGIVLENANCWARWMTSYPGTKHLQLRRLSC